MSSKSQTNSCSEVQMWMMQTICESRAKVDWGGEHIYTYIYIYVCVCVRAHTERHAVADTHSDRLTKRQTTHEQRWKRKLAGWYQTTNVWLECSLSRGNYRAEIKDYNNMLINQARCEFDTQFVCLICRRCGQRMTLTPGAAGKKGSIFASALEIQA